MSTQTHDEANEFLASTGVPSAKFPEVGTTVKGRIAQKPEVQQQRDFDSGELLYWDDGNPKKQVKVVLATDERDADIPDDDGMRALYIKANLQKAVQAALRKAGSKMEAGGFLSVTYTSEGEVKKKGMNAPKLYSAQYTPPSEADANEVVGGAPEPDQPAGQPATQAPAQPAQQQGPDLSNLTPEQVQQLLQAQQQQQS